MKQSVIRLSIIILVALLILSIGGFWGAQSLAKDWSPIQKEIWEMEKNILEGLEAKRSRRIHGIAPQRLCRLDFPF